MANKTRESRSSIRTSYSGDCRASARPRSSLAKPTSGDTISTTSRTPKLIAIVLQKRNVSGRSITIGDPVVSAGSGKQRSLDTEDAAHTFRLERLIGTGVRDHIALAQHNDALAVRRRQIQVMSYRDDQRAATA